MCKFNSAYSNLMLPELGIGLPLMYITNLLVMNCFVGELIGIIGLPCSLFLGVSFLNSFFPEVS